MRKSMQMTQMVQRLCGAGALTAAGTAGLYAGGHHLLTLVPARNVEALTTVAVLAVGLVVLLWYVLSSAMALVCLLGRMTGLVWAGGEALVRRSGAPAVRRLLGGGAGAMLVAGSLLGPAYAEEFHEEATTVSLTWSPAPTAEPEQHPDEVSGDGGTQGEEAPEQPVDDQAPATPEGNAEAEEEEDEASAPGQGSGATHTVQAGDTLWSLAAAALGEDATDAQIAAHWPQWYQVNSEVIGTDPNLIIPGQRLTHPEGSTP